MLTTTTNAFADDLQFFESRIRPLLVNHCQECHSVAGKQEGGLVLDSKAGWQAGGDSGPAILPGQPEQSRLIAAVRWKDESLQMPPETSGGKLTDAQIADLEKWIQDGAFDPRTGPSAPARKSWDQLAAERSDWWSLKPVQATAVPEIRDPEWSSEIDRFLRDRQLVEAIAPSDRATPETLIRRASLVLTGLPPTAGEVAAFVAATQSASDGGEAAYQALIDRLLDSPHYGERFARHWLDVVRFSETHGNEWNYDVPYAWRYRDYVIRAFQDDLPYDRFVKEQIAGDLLEPRWWGGPRARQGAGHDGGVGDDGAESTLTPSPGGRGEPDAASGHLLFANGHSPPFNESPIGTAFFRCGEVNHDSCVQFSVIGYDVVDNQLDTLTKAFQASTIACARCHDHKVDAFSARDYHALLATLRSSRSVQRTIDHPEINRPAVEQLREMKVGIREELVRVWKEEAAALTAERFEALATSMKDQAGAIDSPLRPWVSDALSVADRWKAVAAEAAKTDTERTEFNTANFTTLTDFRQGLPAGWSTDGMGLRNGRSQSGDFVVAHEGDAALKGLLPRGLFTFAESDRLNGALRSPTLQRSRGKVSFEVIGGRFALTRLVFNNCQLNYNHQHSIHHNDWSWVTIDFPEKTDQLHPYAELLTFWDNPKFPDPLGTLGKDTENQRSPFSEHAKNPRTWWGVRRIVLHDGAEVPRAELGYLALLYAGESPATREEAATRYSQIARDALDALQANRASDEQVRWLDWFVKVGLLSNKAAATPALSERIAAYRQIENSLALPTTMPGLADEGDAIPQPFLPRGDHTKPGELVPTGYASVLAPQPKPITGSGRRELAESIASRDNPLTSRVMVNRVWQWVFGRGLVATPDDFGHLGEQPTHPELLDHLAQQFVDDGWSVKQLVRSLVLSRAFRSSSRPTGSAKANDPLNRLLSHYSARRGEAEVIRDSLLAVSGRLDPQLFGPSVHPYREKADPDKRLFTGPLDGAGRRSIYLKFQLMEAPDFLSAFNLPGGKVTQGRREASNTPAQRLALLNDPFVMAMADHWAGELIADGSPSMSTRVEAMFRKALGRSPSTPERERFEQAIRAMAAQEDVSEADLLTSRAVWKDAAHLVFNLSEFLFIP
jgi:hypothetical protein